jgi:tetratricopeptide (TPR) repeat protein
MKCYWTAWAMIVLAAWSFGQQPPAGKTGAANTSASIVIRSALSLEQQGQTEQAIAAWQAVIEAQPGNAQAFAHLGLLEARLQNYPEAIRNYQKAKTLNPSIPQLNLNLGLALFKSGSFKEAGELFQSELKQQPVGPNAPRLKILIAMSHYSARDYAAAIPYLKEAAAADPTNLPLRLTLAHCYLWTKQLDSTLDVYKEILNINADSAEADMIAGEALDEKGDKTGAIAQFQAAEKANPKEPNVHFGLAYLLWTQKRYDEAVPEFKAELDNDPQNAQAMIYLGDTYIQQSQFDLAKSVLLSAAQQLPNVPLLHLDLGIAYVETDQREPAVAELNKAITLEPDSVAAHFRLAKLYQSLGRKEEAKAEFVRASSLNKKTDVSLQKRIADASIRPSPKTDAATPSAQPSQP